MARKMKDSGIEWIGEIPEGWKITRLKYLADFEPTCNTSYLTDESKITYTPMECVKNGGFENRSALYGNLSHTLTPFQNGDIAMAKVTPCFENGNIAIMDNLFSGFGLGSSELFIFRPKSISTRYFFYWLQNKAFVARACSTMTGTGGLKRISPSFIRNCPVHCPSTDEQTKISDYLDAKCSKIDDLLISVRSSIEEYKKLKQAVITQAVTKGVLGEREMKDSEVEWIGEIPKAWIISNIGRFCFVTKLAGFEYTKEMDGHISPYGDVPIVRAQNIKMGRFIPNTREYISLALSQKLSRCALNEKCLIITFIGAGIGEVALFSGATRHHLAPNVAKIVINHDMKQFLDDRFLLYFLMSSAGQEEVNKIKKATAQPSLSMQTIRSIKLAFPSTLQEQKEIADYLDAKCAEIDGLIAKKEQLVKELESYKKSLIYEVVTGKQEV